MAKNIEMLAGSAWGTGGMVIGRLSRPNRRAWVGFLKECSDSRFMLAWRVRESPLPALPYKLTADLAQALSQSLMRSSDALATTLFYFSLRMIAFGDTSAP